MNRLTIFSWGYWGWGNATQQLVQWADAVEKSRGFQPPLFVDIRIRRAVRAAGFNGNAFGESLGEERYAHMPGLGNVAILTHSGPRIQIREPEEAEVLLERALAEGQRGRRVLFFCACEFPGRVGVEGACHRATVADLLVRTARRRGEAIQVVEWPGGEAQGMELNLAEKDAQNLARQAKSVPLGRELPGRELLEMAAGSLVSVRSGELEFAVGVGPLRHGAGGWYFRKIAGPVAEEAARDQLEQWLVRWRKEQGYDGDRS